MTDLVLKDGRKWAGVKIEYPTPATMLMWNDIEQSKEPLFVETGDIMSLPYEWKAMSMAIMCLTLRKHMYWCQTKVPGALASLLGGPLPNSTARHMMARMNKSSGGPGAMPAEFTPEHLCPRLPPANLLVGVTMESCDDIKKLGDLRAMEGARRFVRYRPVVGTQQLEVVEALYEAIQDQDDDSSVEWVLIGGASSAIDPDLVRSVIENCQLAEVPVCFTGWGAWTPTSQVPRNRLGELVDATREHRSGTASRLMDVGRPGSMGFHQAVSLGTPVDEIDQQVIQQFPAPPGAR